MRDDQPIRDDQKQSFANNDPELVIIYKAKGPYTKNLKVGSQVGANGF